MQPTSNRIVYKISDVMEEVHEAIDTICEPVIATLGMRGGNVLYQTDMGGNIITNDGVTIAKNITLKDPLKDAIVSIIKEGALKTNQQVGDGTSTSMLFARNLIKEGLSQVGNGVDRRDFMDALDKAGEFLVSAIKPIEWDDSKMKAVALVSSSNNEEIATFTTQAITAAGEHGFISIQDSPIDQTEVEESIGHVLDAGVAIPELYPDQAKPQVLVKDIHCLVLDNKTYYEEDAEHIIRVALNAGFERIALFGTEFMGDSVNTFVVNHVQKNLEIMLVKVANDTQRSDLTTFLGTESISEAKGKAFSDITEEDFVHVEGIMTSPSRSVIERGGEDSPELVALIEELQRQLEEDKANGQLQQRLGYLSSGIVTIKVGGGAQAEVREKIYKYEDSINAVRNAMKSGYIAGGGIGIRDAYNNADSSILSELEASLAMTIASSSVRHLTPAVKLTEVFDLLENGGEGKGIDLRTGEVVNMVEAGIIEPASVTTNTIENAVSVAKMIISLESLIIYDNKEEGNCCGNRS